MNKKDDLLTTFIDILVSGNKEAESDKGGIRKIAEQLLDEKIKNIMDKNNMRKILWDKINKRECSHQYFFDQFGDCYINQDSFGANMSSYITIRLVPDDHHQYEIKEIPMKDE